MATSTDRTQPLVAAPAPLAPATGAPPPSQRAPVAAAPRATPAPKFGLAWRIFLGIALVVLVVLVVTLAVAQTVASNAADESIRVGLEQTGRRVSDILASQREGMMRQSQLFAAEPSFRSTVGGAIAANDSATLFDQAHTAAEQIGVNVVQLVNAEGTRLARSDDPSAPQMDLSGSALIGGALQGQPSAGFGVLSDTALFDAVAIRAGDNANSPVVMSIRYITDTLARAIGAQTGTDLVFYAVNRDRKREITISPAKLGAKTELRGVIENAMMSSDAKGTTDAHNMMMTSSERRDISIGGRRYVGQHVELLSANGSEVGGFIALRDKDKELAAYYKLRNTLLLAGLGGLLIAFMLSLVISRQIVRPVRLLVGATQRAADGDYAADIPVSTKDEIGTLAEAFKRLLADLRDKQALVDFLQSPTGGRTVAVHQVTPTMAMEAMGTMAAVLEPGHTLAVRYEIKSVLGIGGMGMVYKATDRELGETVAVKTLKPDLVQQDPSALERFKSEIKLARRIAHRNVVRTYDLGENGGVYFITMEFVEGKSLKELIQSRGRLPVSVTLPIAKQLCRALEVAHEEGVIHRDIKPQNMVVQPDGVLKVMDFGIARLAQRTTGHTQAGMVVGTPEYMAPEQLFGEEIDQRADLYAAGAVIYECLTGRLPHEADTPMTLIAKVIEETPRPPRELQPDIPAALSDIVMRTLARDRAQRPQSAGELHDWLDGVTA